MATTDYDAPRPGSVEDPDTESLDAITTARKGAQSPNVDLDETDAADGIELPGADLSGEELTMPVIGETGRRIHLRVLFPGQAPQPARLPHDAHHGPGEPHRTVHSHR